MLYFSVCFFFFSSRRRHTRYIGDWSSDVCSSDLTPQRRGQPLREVHLINISGANITLCLSHSGHEFVARQARPDRKRPPSRCGLDPLEVAGTLSEAGPPEMRSFNRPRPVASSIGRKTG